jgi:beta-glucosidase-like glycosyl hydrolase
MFFHEVGESRDGGRGTFEARISNLLTLLTLSEKQLLLQQNQPAITRLGIPGFTTFTEGLHGIGWSDSGTGSILYMTGTQFPQAFGGSGLELSDGNWMDQ